LQWHSAFVNAYERCPNLPVVGLLPLLGRRGSAASAAAWTVVTRDPAAALAYARGVTTVPAGIAWSLLELIPEHGNAGDVSLALRALEALRFEGLSDPSRLVAFLGRHGAGNLEVVAMARMPMPTTGNRIVWLRIAMQAARGARVQDLAALLDLLPRLHENCAGELCRALEPQLTAEHAGLLARAIEALLAEPLRVAINDAWTEPVTSANVLAWLMSSLGKVGDAAAAPVLQRVITHPGLYASLVTDAARASLQIAGAGRRALLLQMLQSPKLPVACAALDAPELRTDADLRAAARAAVLRLGEQQLLHHVDPFGALDEPDRLALATAILESERFPRLDGDLCCSALHLLGARKDPSLVPTLLRGAAHRVSAVRVAVAQQLGMTFAREAAAPLIEMLKDDQDEVRKEAQQALDQIANYLDARAKWEARLK
jgi:HEAT repeat protein